MHSRSGISFVLVFLALFAMHAAPAAATPFGAGPIMGALAPSNPITSPVGYSDPSGVVVDAGTKKPLAGATVDLYRVPGWTARTGPSQDATPKTCESNKSKAAGAAWTQAAPTNEGGEVDPTVTTIDPPVNPTNTDSSGRFGWSVPAGCWYVLVTYPPDYYSVTSPVVGTPPAVTDLNIALSKRAGGGGVVGGGTGGGGTGGGGTGGGGSRGDGTTTGSCKVPRVVGLSIRRARARLRRAHCRVGSVRSTRSKGRKAGTVLAQRPRPGTRRRAGTHVSLRLAKKK